MTAELTPGMGQPVSNPGLLLTSTGDAMYQLLAVLLVAAVWACKGSESDPASRAASEQASSVSARSRDTTVISSPPENTAVVPVDTGAAGVSEPSPPELDEWISRLARGVDTTTTLREWLTKYPADSVSRAEPTGLYAKSFCRSAAAPVRTGTHVWRRSAVFLIPPAPPGEVLPDTNAVAERLCRLRALWLEYSDQDSVQAYQAASALRTWLTRSLGAGRPGVLLTNTATGDWPGSRSWINGQRVVVVGASPGRSYYSEVEGSDTAPIVQLPTALAVSFVVGNGLDTDVYGLVDQTRYPRVDPQALTAMARGDSAIGWAGLSGLLPLRQLFRHYRDSANFEGNSERPPTDPSVDSLVIHALAALRDTGSLPPPRRAAAFLAADIAVQVRAPWLNYTGRDSLFRLELERAGARYEDVHLGAAYYYLRPWLWRAYQVDSLGPSGKSAFAELLADGWGTNVECGPSPTETIQRGDRAIAAGQADPMIRLPIAEAYAALFSLSPEGVRESDSDSAKALAEKSEHARRQAVERYRSALTGVRDPGLRRTIWDQAVHLMLGLPIETRYSCTGD